MIFQGKRAHLPVTGYLSSSTRIFLYRVTRSILIARYQCSQCSQGRSKTWDFMFISALRPRVYTGDAAPSSARINPYSASQPPGRPDGVTRTKLSHLRAEKSWGFSMDGSDPATAYMLSQLFPRNCTQGAVFVRAGPTSSSSPKHMLIEAIPPPGFYQPVPRYVFLSI